MKQRMQRLSFELRGHRRLRYAFYPQDWPKGALYEVDGIWYQISGYRLADDGNAYEVWGKPVRAQR